MASKSERKMASTLEPNWHEGPVHQDQYIGSKLARRAIELGPNSKVKIEGPIRKSNLKPEIETRNQN